LEIAGDYWRIPLQIFDKMEIFLGPDAGVLGGSGGVLASFFT